jgi:hypothetical protein
VISFVCFVSLLLFFLCAHSFIAASLEDKGQSSRAVEAAANRSKHKEQHGGPPQKKKEGKWDSGECACDPIGRTGL